MINDLIGILCRFRKEHIAICCDIERMFHQFKVNQEHRDYLTLLWWENEKYDDEPSEFRMTVHLFGAVSSPGCANFAMRKAADDGESDFGEAAANFIRNNFYVDDGLTSVASVDEAKELIQNTVNLCKSKGLRLHKFISNDYVALENLPPTERAIDAESLMLDNEHLPVERTLGLQWCIQSDCFKFQIVLKDRPSTRRGILSTVYSLYDPLGLLSPVILQGRIILQDICRGGYDWDSPLPDSIVQKWLKWRHSLFELECLKVNRCFKPQAFKDISSVQLHHFSDASNDGYGQCSYLRLTDSDGHIHCSLVMGKSRVTPLKQITIPRLELTAAVLSVTTSNILHEQLQYESVDEHFWCDSQVTLGYISNEAKRFHIFVANRVQKIRERTEPRQWHFVGTKENPADFASRGLSVQQFLKKSSWFDGPKFLWEETLPYETAIETPVIAPDDPELKKQVLAVDAVERFDLSRLEYFSSWNRLKKAVALCLKYKAILLSRVRGVNTPQSANVTIQDIQAAEVEVLKLVQSQAFDEELRALHAQRNLKKRNALYKLDPFVDISGVLRIGGRIQEASLAWEVKHPTILPKTSHISSLIVKDCHEYTVHQGRGITVNTVRSHGYWIIGCRSLVSSLIARCVTCKRLRGAVMEQKMADLPSDRMEIAPAFTYCAVDYFGPFLIKEKRSTLKRYGVLFTCMVTRAVHIEVACSLDTDSFINALRRFIAIRGPIRQLRSDMGTNFVGAKNELQSDLKNLSEDEVKEFLKNSKCDYFEFKTNVPKASHMGGVWERQIGTVRTALSAILQKSNQQLDDESLRTFMYEAMSIVNSRPLTTETQCDASSPEPLTPNHFLHMKTCVVLPPPGEFQENHLYHRKRWLRVQHLLNSFWKRWQKEYLQTLQPRSKWIQSNENLKRGDIVLVNDENVARCEWKLACVEDTIPSNDGHIRKVKLRLGTRELDSKGRRVNQNQPIFLKRPIQKLVLLQKRDPSPPRSQGASRY